MNFYCWDPRFQSYIIGNYHFHTLCVKAGQQQLKKKKKKYEVFLLIDHSKY